MTKSINIGMIDAFRDFIQPHLEEFGKIHGIHVEDGLGRYGHTSGTIKIEFSQLDESGKAVDPEAEYLKLSHPELVGTGVILKGRKYRITGFNPAAPKNCINITRDDGKRFKCPISTVLTCQSNGQVFKVVG